MHTGHGIRTTAGVRAWRGCGGARSAGNCTHVCTAAPAAAACAGCTAGQPNQHHAQGRKLRMHADVSALHPSFRHCTRHCARLPGCCMCLICHAPASPPLIQHCALGCCRFDCTLLGYSIAPLLHTALPCLACSTSPQIHMKVDTTLSTGKFAITAYQSRLLSLVRQYSTTAASTVLLPCGTVLLHLILYCCSQFGNGAYAVRRCVGAVCRRWDC